MPAKAASKTDQPTVVKAKNLTRFDYIQPVTRTPIKAFEEAQLLDDGWLKAQVHADLLEYV